MKTNRNVAVALGIAALLAAASLQAQEKSHAYLGIGIGNAKVDENITNGLITSGQVDSSNFGWKAFGGLELHRNFALELGLMQLGKANYSGTFGATPVTDGEVWVSGWNLSAVGQLPLGEQFTLFGKLGFLAWGARARDITGGIPFERTVNGTDLSWGVGMNFDLTKQLSFRIEGERFNLDNTPASLVTLGMFYRFGR